MVATLWLSCIIGLLSNKGNMLKNGLIYISTKNSCGNTMVELNNWDYRKKWFGTYLYTIDHNSIKQRPISIKLCKYLLSTTCAFCWWIFSGLIPPTIGVISPEKWVPFFLGQLCSLTDHTEYLGCVNHPCWVSFCISRHSDSSQLSFTRKTEKMCDRATGTLLHIHL